MKNHFLTALLMMSFFKIAAQSQLTCNVTDETRRPLPFANVLLLAPSDSTLVSGVVTAEDGNYRFENIANGTYLLSVTMIGFSSYYSEVFTLQSSKNMGAIALNLYAAWWILTLFCRVMLHCSPLLLII